MSGMMHSRPFRCSGIRIHMSQSQSWGGETATHTQLWGQAVVVWPSTDLSGCPHQVQPLWPQLCGWLCASSNHCLALYPAWVSFPV